MARVDDIWDKLVGSLRIYVDNYELKDRRLKPSYTVDYEIPGDIMSEVKKSYTSGVAWYSSMMEYRNINELPPYLKELAIQYLPRFLKQYPEYAEEDCIKVVERWH